MSILYGDEVLILNLTVSPMLALIVVAKPSMLGSPPPVASQLASPVLEFSQATGFTTGASHGAAEADVLSTAMGTTAAATKMTKAMILLSTGCLRTSVPPTNDM